MISSEDGATPLLNRTTIPSAPLQLL